MVFETAVLTRTRGEITGTPFANRFCRQLKSYVHRCKLIYIILIRSESHILYLQHNGTSIHCLHLLAAVGRILSITCKRPKKWCVWATWRSTVIHLNFKFVLIQLEVHIGWYNNCELEELIQKRFCAKDIYILLLLYFLHNRRWIKFHKHIFLFIGCNKKPRMTCLYIGVYSDRRILV